MVAQKEGVDIVTVITLCSSFCYIFLTFFTLQCTSSLPWDAWISTQCTQKHVLMVVCSFKVSLSLWKFSLILDHNPIWANSGYKFNIGVKRIDFSSHMGQLIIICAIQNLPLEWPINITVLSSFSWYMTSLNTPNLVWKKTETEKVISTENNS